MQIFGQTWLNLVTWTCGSWNGGQHDLYFTVQWFCLISRRLLWISVTRRMTLNVGHRDLYLMVQWLCLIPWRLFHVWTSLFGIMNQYDRMHDLKINICHRDLYFLYPGIYGEGYIVFVFPFVCTYIRSFVRTSVPFVELLYSFTFKFLKWGISQQPLIRKHSYLDHKYPGGLAFIPWLVPQGSCPRVGLEVKI